MILRNVGAILLASVLVSPAGAEQSLTLGNIAYNQFNRMAVFDGSQNMDDVIQTVSRARSGDQTIGVLSRASERRMRSKRKTLKRLADILLHRRISFTLNF